MVIAAAHEVVISRAFADELRLKANNPHMNKVLDEAIRTAGDDAKELTIPRGMDRFMDVDAVIPIKDVVAKLDRADPQDRLAGADELLTQAKKVMDVIDVRTRLNQMETAQRQQSGGRQWTASATRTARTLE